VAAPLLQLSRLHLLLQLSRLHLLMQLLWLHVFLQLSQRVLMCCNVSPVRAMLCWKLRNCRLGCTPFASLFYIGGLLLL
jgi:hypothetical protein